MAEVTWMAPSKARKYGGALLDPGARATSGSQGVDHVTAPSAHPDSGVRAPVLVAFGVLAAATVGLMAYSTTARVGPVSASLDVGK